MKYRALLSFSGPLASVSEGAEVELSDDVARALGPNLVEPVEEEKPKAKASEKASKSSSKSTKKGGK